MARQRLCKKKGNRVLCKKNEAKILYLALLLVLSHLQDFLLLFIFPKPCSPPFYTTFATNSYISPTFSLENVFLYFFPCRQFLRIAASTEGPPSPLPLRQMPAFAQDKHWTERHSNSSRFWRYSSRRLALLFFDVKVFKPTSLAKSGEQN